MSPAPPGSSLVTQTLCKHGAGSTYTPQCSAGPHGRTHGNPGDNQKGTSLVVGNRYGGRRQHELGHVGTLGQLPAPRVANRIRDPAVFPQIEQLLLTATGDTQRQPLMALAPAMASAPQWGQWEQHWHHPRSPWAAVAHSHICGRFPSRSWLLNRAPSHVPMSTHRPCATEQPQRRCRAGLLNALQCSRPRRMAEAAPTAVSVGAETRGSHCTSQGCPELGAPVQLSPTPAMVQAHGGCAGLQPRPLSS